MKKIFILLYYLVIISACNANKSNIKTDVNTKLSKKEVLDKLGAGYWMMKSDNIEANADTLYQFVFSKIYKNKGRFIAIRERYHIISETKFKIMTYKKNSITIKFYDKDAAWTSELFFITKHKILMDGVYYNNVVWD